MKGLDLDLIAGSQGIIDAVERKDFAEIVSRLRDPLTPITQDERDFLADYLEGKVTWPRGKPRSRKEAEQLEVKKDTARAMFLWLTKIDGWPIDAAKLRCAELLGLSASSINSYLKGDVVTAFGLETLVYQLLRPIDPNEKIEPIPSELVKRLVFGAAK